MEFRYGLDDRPAVGELLLYGVQWFALLIPVIVIIGKIAGGFHISDPGDQIIYLQKLTFVMAIALLSQVLWGHRLPLITGPSTVLLIGIIASRGFAAATINTSIMAGGALLVLLSAAGLFGHLNRLFTTRIVASVLLLIAFTLLPTIVQLITSGPSPLASLLFSLFFTLCLFSLHRYLQGIGKSMLIVWAMILGTPLYFLLFPETLKGEHLIHTALISGFFHSVAEEISFDAGVMVSFIVCFTALAINDLGSIQSMNELLKTPDPERRVTRGILITGLSNIASGFLGVIGPVNFSLSPGVVTASGCASRFTLLPTAVLLLALSFSPVAIGIAGLVPPVLIGSILIYILSSQLSAGLLLISESAEGFSFTTGLVIGPPLLLGTIIAFLPADVVQGFPAILRPLLGNGFVVGISAALILEHLIVRDQKA